MEQTLHELGILSLPIVKQRLSKFLLWCLLPVHTNLVLVQSDTQGGVDG